MPPARSAPNGGGGRGVLPGGQLLKPPSEVRTRYQLSVQPNARAMNGSVTNPSSTNGKAEPRPTNGTNGEAPPDRSMKSRSAVRWVKQNLELVQSNDEWRARIQAIMMQQAGTSEDLIASMEILREQLELTRSESARRARVNPTGDAPDGDAPLARAEKDAVQNAVKLQALESAAQELTRQLEATRQDAARREEEWSALFSKALQAPGAYAQNGTGAYAPKAAAHDGTGEAADGTGFWIPTSPPLRVAFEAAPATQLTEGENQEAPDVTLEVAAPAAVELKIENASAVETEGGSKPKLRRKSTAGLSTFAKAGVSNAKDAREKAGSLIENQLTSKIADRLRHMQEETEDMPLEGSMWGVAVLIGIPVLGKAASAYLLFLLFLTVTCQSIIIYILSVTTMTKPDFDDDSVAELREWRRQVAHHVSNFDSISGDTLLQKICDVRMRVRLES